MKASVEMIRAAGFEWPKHEEIGRRLVLDGEQIDLDATRAGIQVAAEYYRGQLGEMKGFSDTWSAPESDVSDRGEDYRERELQLLAAASYLSEVIAGLGRS